MNTKNLKAYAPKARTQFIDAVKKRAAQFGIYKDRIEEVRIEGGAAIIEGRAFTRKEGEQRKRLENKVAERGYEMFIREMAYTWFNRLAALRYMEIHDYFDHGFRVLSHPTNQDSLPEILNHASDVAESLDLDKSHVIELQLAGDKEEELYRELLLGQCHHLSKIMPFMFEAIDDAAELLLPNNLTKTDSILKGLINDIPEEDWQEIEVIGWLYQFYISEHKDAVIGKVVKSEDIPAATQLFTPNWIVKYLVQNSVGRQWLATYPDSELKGKMDYYIEPAEQSDEVIEQLKAITPTSIDPEEIKVLDPACGSGHILVEVYEVLREIYLERGYRLREIPELILTKNIYGLDIDDRAAQLAGFALMMKAREDDRRIFQRVEDGQVSLNVFSLQSTEHLDIPKLWKALDLESNQRTGSTGSLFDTSEEFVQPGGVYQEYFELLQELKLAFLQAKTLGSLIQIEHQHLTNLLAFKEILLKKVQGSDPAAKQAALEFLSVINQSISLAKQYDAVIANPPYMGNKGMNTALRNFRERMPTSKYDLFSMFIENALNNLTDDKSTLSFVVPQSWMFLTTFSKFREYIQGNYTITSLNHFDGELLGVGFKISAFNIVKNKIPQFVTSFTRNLDGDECKIEKCLDELQVIPGKPISYWVSDAHLDAFKNGHLLEEIAKPKAGMLTTNNDKFVRFWWEVNAADTFTSAKSSQEASKSNKKWFPYNKGGGNRKWYGNNIFLVNFKNDGQEICDYIDSQPNVKVKSNGRVTNRQYYFKRSITWSDIGFSDFSARSFPEGAIFDITGMSAFPEDDDYEYLLGLFNTNVMLGFMGIINPTFHFQAGDMARVPLKRGSFEQINAVKDLVRSAVKIAKLDWDKFELSHEFKLEHYKPGLVKAQFEEVIESERDLVDELISNEKELNRIFSTIYNLPLQSEKNLQPDLFCNFYEGAKWLINKSRRAKVESLFSNFIGCIMGRYSLDQEGIVYAKSGNEGFKELEAGDAYKTIPADDDGIVPLASEDWLFDDDATTRFKEFVKTVWGGEHLSENLEFVSESLCLHALKPKKGENAMDTIRRYFSTQFFKDHCKTYKKRPIYWLFSSGKEKAFECLVYLHRYNEGTLSRMRTEYVTPLMGKYDAQHTLLSEQQLQATGTEARRIEKELKSLEKKQAELRTFDEQLKHYAEMRITLDLDDGVKANYGKFGNLLADVKTIHGKAVK
mgnify:CR=1 FL=1